MAGSGLWDGAVVAARKCRQVSNRWVGIILLVQTKLATAGFGRLSRHAFVRLLVTAVGSDTRRTREGTADGQHTRVLGLLESTEKRG